MSETCWDSVDNKHLIDASCWFSLSLHNVLTMHGHRNLNLDECLKYSYIERMQFNYWCSSPTSHRLLRPCYDALVEEGGDGQQTWKAMANVSKKYGSAQPKLGGFSLWLLGEGLCRRNDKIRLRNAYDKFVRKLERYHVVDLCVNWRVWVRGGVV